eukprot:7773920-Ditylum_brightwellii.AAC.2
MKATKQSCSAHVWCNQGMVATVAAISYHPETQRAERKFSMSLSTPPQSKEAHKDSFMKTVWEIGRISTLPNAGDIFPLERSQVSVNGGVLPNTIGQRIIDCLKDLSISIASKRRYKLVAESLDRDIRFNIKLYKE